jgi:hypothetical protein
MADESLLSLLARGLAVTAAAANPNMLSRAHTEDLKVFALQLAGWRALSEMQPPRAV